MSYLLLLVSLLSIPLPGDESDVPLPGADTTFLPSGSGELEFRGYVENTFNCEYSKSQSQELLLNSTRARLNLSGKPNKNLDFGIGIIGTLNSGATMLDLAGYIPDGQFVSGASMIFSQEIENEIFLQEAFGTLYTPNFRIRIGRHKVYTGTGYAYNPIDVFNYKNPLDPTYEINGLDSMLATANLPHQTELQGFIKFADQLSTTGYMLRLKTYISGYDIALQYSEHTKERVDWETLNTSEAIAALSQGAAFEDFVSEFRWHLLGGEFVGELSGVGIHGEGGYVFVDSRGDANTLTHTEENHARFLIGADYTFGFQLYLITEYLHIGQGRTDSSEITFNDRMAYFTGEILSANRDTLFTGSSYPLTDFIDISVYIITALNDPSAIINPKFDWNVYSGAKLSISAYVPIGDEQGQNSKSGSGGFARLRFNF